MCSQHGMCQEFANIGLPFENGVMERRNKTIVEIGLTMLAHGDLPQFIWAEATSTAVHILNRYLTTMVPRMTPFEA